MPSSPAPFISKLIVYILLYVVSAWVASPVVQSLGGYFAGVTLSQIVAAVAVNWLALRIFGRFHLTDLGLKWNRASMRGSRASCIQASC